jgi:hypothetical protein
MGLADTPTELTIVTGSTSADALRALSNMTREATLQCLPKTIIKLLFTLSFRALLPIRGRLSQIPDQPPLIGDLVLEGFYGAGAFIIDLKAFGDIRGR